MKDSLGVVIVAAEASPFAGEGKIADTVRVLAEGLVRRDCRAALILPKYRRPSIEALHLDLAFSNVRVPLGADAVKASVFRTELLIPGPPAEGPSGTTGPPSLRLPVYFIDCPKYFGRDRIYGSESADYLDNDERFTFFCRAVLEFIGKARIGADIIHCHDWPAALIPLFLKTRYAAKRHFRNTASVFTLHDPKTQGVFPPESFALTGLTWDFFTPEQLALNGRFNFVKAALIFADALNAANAKCARTVRSAAAPSAALRSVLDRRGAGANAGPENVFPVIDIPAAATGGPIAAQSYLDLYRRAMEVHRGGSHVR